MGAEYRICAGDVVGYGAAPGECIEMLSEAGAICIRGNHDADADTLLSGGRLLRTDQTLPIEFACEQLDGYGTDFIRRLPDTVREAMGGRTFVAVHGSPRDPLRERIPLHDYGWMRHDFTDGEFGRVFGVHILDAGMADVLVVGHTHVPGGIAMRYRDGACGRSAFLLNPGSVGQPRTCDPRANWTLVDTETMEVETRMVPYDVGGAFRRIIHAGLPERFAYRLLDGR
jgi:predicted phosphodiesterase